jgi:hypothetical protein
MLICQILAALLLSIIFILSLCLIMVKKTMDYIDRQFSKLIDQKEEYLNYAMINDQHQLRRTYRNIINDLAEQRRVARNLYFPEQLKITYFRSREVVKKVLTKFNNWRKS